MVNQREMKVLEKYEEDGWSTIRCGAPDFLFLKEENGDIKNTKFVEVKSPSGNFRYEQKIWKKVLEDLGADFEVVVVE